MKINTVRPGLMGLTFVVAALLVAGTPRRGRAASLTAGTGVATPRVKPAAVAPQVSAVVAAGAAYNSVSGATPPNPSAPGEICFAAKSLTAKEGAVRKVTVQRVFGSYGTVSVSYRMKAGTASAGADYVAKKGTLTWLSGDTTPKVIKIPIVADGLPESNERFQVTLFGAVGATLIAPVTTTLTITGDLPAAPAPLAAAAGGMAFDWLTEWMATGSVSLP